MFVGAFKRDVFRVQKLEAVALFDRGCAASFADLRHFGGVLQNYIERKVR